MVRPGRTMSPLTCAFTLERVTGIEPALSAWEAVPSGPVTRPDLRGGVSATDRERPVFTGVNGPLMARADRSPARVDGRALLFPVLLDSCHLSGRAARRTAPPAYVSSKKSSSTRLMT